MIKDAIQAAGGATAQANLDVVNQALELQDQQHIHIPAKADNLPTPPVVEGGVRPTPTAGGSASVTVSHNSAVAGGQKININTASAAELELLPGVGPTIARRIVDYRQANGNFTTIEALMDVKGIGQATFDKLKDYVTVE
ncbi:MAG: helix-hairpin-helix domain-containing protein [Caldilineae bacterium]|nr:MAG: helix-hairpin-helix domain-containing protein [Caldilineae bacterium]